VPHSAETYRAYQLKIQSLEFTARELVSATDLFRRLFLCTAIKRRGKRWLPPQPGSAQPRFVQVSWLGYNSDSFVAYNGVKQGGVSSPVLFCVYIDELLVQLSRAGVGCYIGNIFTGALAYADDIVLMAPTPTAMCKMLSICDRFAADNDICFNASKSKCVIIHSKRARCL
jgi:hypothetical protein